MDQNGIPEIKYCEAIFVLLIVIVLLLAGDVLSKVPIQPWYTPKKVTASLSLKRAPDRLAITINFRCSILGNEK